MVDTRELGGFIAKKIEEHFGVKVVPEAVQLEFNDWRWIAAVKDLAVVFVAEDDVAAGRLNSERTVLRLLQGRVGFGVPVPVYCSSALPQVDIRAFAPGSMNASEAAAAGLTQLCDGAWPPSRIRDALEARLDSALHPLFHRGLDWHTRNRQRPAAEAVLVHHDFGSHNFTFDRETGLPCGLFDFQTMCWNDRHCDFNLLPSYADEIMTRTIETYSELTGKAISIDQVRLHHAVYALSNAAWRTTYFAADATEVTGGLNWVAQALAACDGL